MLPAVRLLTSLVLLTVVYGVPELCVMVVYASAMVALWLQGWDMTVNSITIVSDDGA